MTKIKKQKKEDKPAVDSNFSASERLDILKDLTNNLLELMGTTSKGVVSYDQENDALIVTIEGGEETGLLIGRKGETLTSIQTMLSILLKQSVGDWHRVVVNVGDYRQKEEDYLKNLAESTASRAKETGEPQSLYNLNPAQRRIVHMTLSEDSQIVTESMGEGNERYLIVKVK
jgi:spoIIIJ-associated protein